MRTSATHIGGIRSFLDDRGFHAEFVQRSRKQVIAVFGKEFLFARIVRIEFRNHTGLLDVDYDIIVVQNLQLIEKLFGSFLEVGGLVATNLSDQDRYCGRVHMPSESSFPK